MTIVFLMGLKVKVRDQSRVRVLAGMVLAPQLWRSSGGRGSLNWTVTGKSMACSKICSFGHKTNIECIIMVNVYAFHFFVVVTLWHRRCFVGTLGKLFTYFLSVFYHSTANAATI